MNKDKELEEAIKQLKDLVIDRESFIQNDSDHDDIFLKDKKAIEMALEALTDTRKQYQEGYLRGRKEEEKEMLKVIKMHYIERKKIEDKIEELNEELKNYKVDVNCSHDKYYELSDNYAFAEEKLKQLLED